MVMEPAVTRTRKYQALKVILWSGMRAPRRPTMARLIGRGGGCWLRGQGWLRAAAASAALNRPVQRGLELAFDTGCFIRTAQVTGPFDRSPLLAPSREVYERSTAGTFQVSRRSAETDAAPAS